MNDLHYSLNIVRGIKSRRMGWAGHVARMGRGEAFRVLVVNPEGKRTLGRRSSADEIKMDLQEVGCGVMDWIEVVQDGDRWLVLVNEVMNFRVPYNFLTSCKPVSRSRRTLLHAVSNFLRIG